MKCQNCGRSDASFHYRSNVNGQVTEQHLCPECAANMEGSVFSSELNNTAGGQDFSQFLLSPETMFGNNSIWDRMAKDLFSDFWRGPQIVMISPRAIKLGEAEAEAQVKAQPASAPIRKAADIPLDAGEKIKRRMELNKLRSEMQSAIREENFERAAELRDKIYALEKNVKQA